MKKTSLLIYIYILEKVHTEVTILDKVHIEMYIDGVFFFSFLESTKIKRISYLKKERSRVKGNLVH